MRKIPSAKLCLISASVMLIGVLFITPAISLISSSTIIKSSGTTSEEVYATSGCVATIQAAIDQAIASGETTVMIPEGTFTFEPKNGGVEFNVPVSGLNIFGAGSDKTILEMPIDDAAPNTIMFFVNGENGGKVRFSGITFKGRPNWQSSPTGDYAVRLESCTDFRVDHCDFYYMGAAGVAVYDVDQEYGHSGGDYALVSQGVVDHCNFYEIYKPACTSAGRGYGYGVSVMRTSNYLWCFNIYPDSPWTGSDGFGKYYKNTYIEDCYFHGCRHAAQAVGGGAYVLRYSTIEDIGMHTTAITGHPVRTNNFGQLYCEIYDVTIKRVDGPVSFLGPLVEGGYGLIYDNHFENLAQWMELGNCEDVDGTPYYPLGCTSETYVWNNEIVNCGGLMTHSNIGLGGCPAPVENVDYFLYAPPPEKNYVPYIYPHPLTLESQ
jgi:hypothetical protein